MRKEADVLVVGAGPAGLALAAALGERSLRVVGLAPDPRAPWPNTYGVWHDEVEPLGYAPFLSHIWRDTVVNLGRADGDGGRVTRGWAAPMPASTIRRFRRTCWSAANARA